jgi:hypothetical protein
VLAPGCPDFHHLPDRHLQLLEGHVPLKNINLIFYIKDQSGTQKNAFAQRRLWLYERTTNNESDLFGFQLALEPKIITASWYRLVIALCSRLNVCVQ